MLMTECYQKLSSWLCSSSDRASRTYLEAHLDLLVGEYEQFLELFISEHSDSPGEQQRLSNMKLLLKDANARGGTQQAVRDAYVNVFGGLILDLPVWLQDLERLPLDILSACWTDRLVAFHKIRLRDTINVALANKQIAPEIVAELQYQLGNLFTHNSPKHSTDVLKTVVNYYQASLQVYAPERYPLQFAKVQVALDNTYNSITVR